MKIEILEPFGARLGDIAVGPLNEADVAQLEELLAENGVVIMPGQNIGDDEFLGFLESFGNLVFTEGETPVADYPDLNVVSNVGRTTPPKSTFHVDTTYVARPPAYTALRAVDVPEFGGNTLFTNQYAAFSTLPRKDREFALSRSVTHTVSGLADVSGSAVHPLVLVHPISGRKSLYLSAPVRCTSVSDMSEIDGAEFVRYLVDHSTRAGNVYRHPWSAGDVVMWDNRCVMHKADHAGVVGDRVMHRGMVAPR